MASEIVSKPRKARGADQMIKTTSSQVRLKRP